jgi:2-polyprenyl-3-methyl-5-hydroxy-6-metoxy-1,4-benzoquinol methylase
MVSEMNKTKDAYDDKYKKGYGVMHPEGHVIRIYEKFLKYELGITGENKKLLDFGCGNGTHSVYFKSKGFDVYGVDTSEQAIEICNSRLGKGNFRSIVPGQNIQSLYKEKFDVIFSNQVLYYLPDSALKDVLEQMNNMLMNDGIVIFSMMGPKNYYYSLAAPEIEDGLQKVTVTGRLNEVTYINFVENETELQEKFKLFDPIFIGYYDILIREGSGFHYYYIGRKK